MGVRGLTTFINSNADIFFVKIELHDCILIIDGNSFASVLYSETLGPFSAFGGDYDVFASNVENFINNLKKCNIEPIFIFDGGYEAKKLTTVRKRNAMKVFAIEKVSPDKPAREFFPYLMRPVLQETIVDLGVTCLQSDFEADREIAAIAKRLNAPVLSNDSDFFIFDVPFIPFSGFSFEMCRSTKKSNDYNFMPCKLFYVDNFLKSFGGLNKDMLPLLASVLGNDYLNRSVFKNFYGLIKLDKGKKMTLGRRRVGAFVRWLKNENFETALNKILSSLPKNRRQRVKQEINTIVNGYADLSTCLDQFLPKISNKPIDMGFDKICSDIKGLKIQDNLEIVEEEELVIAENSHSEDSLNDDDDDEDQSEISLQPSRTSKVDLPEWFLERSRKCQIAPQVMTLFSLKTYFSIPQMEDCSLPHAGEIGLPILQVISGVILGSTSITYWHRHGSNTYRKQIINTCNTFKDNNLPRLSTVNDISLKERQQILLDTMLVENSNFLDLFPKDWHLLIMCLIYWLKSNHTLRPQHVHAVIMMFIVVNIHQSKIGIFRKRRLFVKKYGTKVKSLEKLRENIIAKFNNDIDGTLNEEQFTKITIDDCLITFDAFLPLFDIDTSIKDRPRTFQRNIVHTFAELQTIFDLAQILNSILLQPYNRLQISKFYNGTFLYNVAADFKRQNDIITCMEKLYKRAPNLLNLHILLYNCLSKFNDSLVITPRALVKKKRKKQKKKFNINNNKSNDDSDTDENVERFHDENNKFCLLHEATNF